VQTMIEDLAARVVRGPLVDLAQLGGHESAGILTPQTELGTVKVGITEQFLGEAKIYHERYSNIPYWSWLISEATRGRFRESPSMILDIGSGSGNSVLPSLEMFPEARIVACDLSERLLAILRDYLRLNASAQERISLVCVDATRAEFIEESVDLVIGAAILHHLIDPVPCIQRACTALRRGGIALFFEPFEAGHAILRMAYERILAEDEARGSENLPEATARTLRALNYDFQVRAGSDKSAEIFKKIDDKWLFTRHYFAAVAAGMDRISLEITPLWAGKDAFVMQTRTYLRLAQGLNDEQVTAALPSWAWDILRSVDAALSLELKQDLPLEARVIFQRT